LRRLLAFAAIVAVGVLWWHFPSSSRLHIEPSAADIFEEADTWELLSLTPYRSSGREEIAMDGPSPPDRYRWYPILGQATLDRGAERSDLTRAFNRGRRGWDQMVAMCFNPRHLIRARLDDGRSAELLICFECGQYYVYDASNGRIEQGVIHGFPSATFNRIYESLGLEIAPDICGDAASD
jgi:hypothetical protein